MYGRCGVGETETHSVNMVTVMVISVKFVNGASHPTTCLLHAPPPPGFCSADPSYPNVIDIPGSLATVLRGHAPAP